MTTTKKTADKTTVKKATTKKAPSAKAKGAAKKATPEKRRATSKTAASAPTTHPFAGYDPAATITPKAKPDKSPFRKESIRDKAFRGILASKTVGEVREKVSRDPWHLKYAVANKYIEINK